ncbi:arginine--tRNA ligase [Paracoccaceae bacterium]|nr:arginine--tRNA ligase [Paracoccaceae bacterium]
MDIVNILREKILNAVNEYAEEKNLKQSINTDIVVVERPKKQHQGDYSTNVAMVLAKALSSNPREIGELIRSRLREEEIIESVSLDGPGFLNITFDLKFWNSLISEIMSNKNLYGKFDFGQGRKANLEFVSANPTGPLHLGHVRGAVFGDALSRLLEFVGFQVTKEYYVNDGGAQIGVLVRTVYYRYLQKLGEDIDLPDGSYPGDYLLPLAESLIDKFGKKLKDLEEYERDKIIRELSVGYMMKVIKSDLKSLNIEMDNFFSEQTMINSNVIETSINNLKDKGLIYTGTIEAPKGKTYTDWQAREQLLFKSTKFGDDIDRPIKKSDGSWTYFAPDMAYHADKLKRGFDVVIDILGADHSGYVSRLGAVIKAFAEKKVEFEVKLVQLVKLIKNKKLLKMSKRAGDYVLIQDLLEEVSPDVIRFVMLSRNNDVPLDFDIDLMLSKSKDNPVFYVNYAHARIVSVLKRAAELKMWPITGEEDLEKRTTSFIENELTLVKKLSEWPNVVKQSAKFHEPHRIAFYLNEVASSFHSLYQSSSTYGQYRFIVEGSPDLCTHRLALANATQIVIKNGLSLLGIVPLDEMY